MKITILLHEQGFGRFLSVQHYTITLILWYQLISTCSEQCIPFFLHYPFIYAIIADHIINVFRKLSHQYVYPRQNIYSGPCSTLPFLY